MQYDEKLLRRVTVFEMWMIFFLNFPRHIPSMKVLCLYGMVVDSSYFVLCTLYFVLCTLYFEVFLQSAVPHDCNLVVD